MRVPCPNGRRGRVGALAFAPGNGLAVLPAPARADDASATIERVKQSVVAVGTFERTRSPQFSFRGTGFVVDDGTLVVTNAHVLPGPPDRNRLEQLGILIPQPGSAAASFREARRSPRTRAPTSRC